MKLSVAAACALACWLPCQSVTSPKGLDSTEGGQSFFASTNRRYQSIDATHVGTVLLIKSFNLRRDRNSSHTPGASTVDATVDMGTVNIGAVYSEMDRNYLPNTRKNVFPRANVNWPDWSTASSTPAPFDFKIPLKTTFVYVGNDALVWDLKLENGTNTGNKFDRDFTTATSNNGANLGVGCNAPGQSGAFLLTSVMQNSGAPVRRMGMRLRTGALRAPRSTPVSLSVSLTDANANVGFCTNLRANPLVIVPLGMSDATGRLYDCYFNTAFDATIHGARLVTQAFSLTSSGLILSNGESNTMPVSTATSGHDAAYVWSPLTRTPNNGLVFVGGSLIAQLEQ